ncbi:hypothetical protein GCM10009039_14960 [Halocalculus aciditolerans]|uniref:HNH endonuclease n=1 Tax=Halocalculus aciditolerans TaxID=1383812 RepID=A0A830FJ35_9EURY|nr:hypothetical protein GCM10009039_14960 [Halocalculus aciditolerans]
MIVATQQTGDHVIGPTPRQTQGYASLRTKPTTQLTDTRVDSGGGYERWRSTEWRPHTARQGKEDIYLYHHRLLAVVACYDVDDPIEDVLADLAGRDVHHESGVEWDNRPSNLTVMDHGRHSETTQAQRRAWAADTKRDVETASEPETDESVCVACGEPAETPCRSEGFDGVRCLGCAMRDAGDHSIEVGA